MKTPIEELMNFINDNDRPTIEYFNKAKELLEKEKKVIIEAFNEARDSSFLSCNRGFRRGNDYYKETFKNK